MLPKVLCNLIEIYNETGQYLINKENLYWFNGKRFEFFINCNPYKRVIFFKNKVYFVRNAFNCRQYKNQKLLKINHAFKWNHVLNNHGIFLFGLDYALLKEDESFECFDGNRFIRLASPNYPCGKLSAYKNMIYHFSQKNVEMFIIEKNEWIELPTYNKKLLKSLFITAIILMNNLFYIIFNDLSFILFDPQLNQWK
jgi:hypothetical protein